jgi:glycerol uptake facilitator-like aquaporin
MEVGSMDTFRVYFPFFLVGGMFAVLLVCMFLAVWAEKSSTKRKEKLAQILMMYAERGEAPPQSIIDGMAILRPRSTLKPPKPETRARHFSEFASCFVFAIGAAGIAWWRVPAPGEKPEALMVLAIVVALIFAAGAVSHLVTALHIRDGQ